MKTHSTTRRAYIVHFLVMVKVNEDAPGRGPTAKMGAFNDTLVRDDMLFAAEGLQDSSKGTRISFAGAKPVVTDGPFSEAKEVVGGFWILQGSSQKEIVERLLQCPFEQGESVEIREISGGRRFPRAVETTATTR
jgi:hypothetical protein